jgi:hypothetical protein
MKNVIVAGASCLVAFAVACSGADASSDASDEAVTNLGVKAKEIPLPNGTAGVGFDDFQYSATLDRILVPAGRTGNIDLIDPASRDVTAIGGFSAKDDKLSAAIADVGGGHDFGVTSAIEGRGLLFATDRTTGSLSVVRPGTSEIVGTPVKLAASPDYVRFVPASPDHADDELWVAEPDGGQIEVFTLPAGDSPTPVQSALIKITDGPESLVIDSTRQRAYGNVKDATIAIDLRSHQIVGQWSNGCSSTNEYLGTGAKGLALDEARGYLFVGCAEGRASSIDVAAGKLLSTKNVKLAAVGFAILDMVAFSASLSHLYVVHSDHLEVLGVSDAGNLAILGRIDIPHGSHSVVADTRGNAYVGDQLGGKLLQFKDALPASH